MRLRTGALVAAIAGSMMAFAGCEPGGSGAFYDLLSAWYQPVLEVGYNDGPSPEPTPMSSGESVQIDVRTDSPGSSVISLQFANVGWNQYTLDETGNTTFQDSLSVSSVTASNAGPSLSIELSTLKDPAEDPIDALPASSGSVQIFADPALANGETQQLTLVIESNDPLNPTAEYTFILTGDSSLNI